MISNTKNPVEFLAELRAMETEELAERISIVEQAKSANILTVATELDGLALIEPDDMKRRAMRIGAEVIRRTHVNLCRAMMVITEHEHLNAIKSGSIQ